MKRIIVIFLFFTNVLQPMQGSPKASFFYNNNETEVPLIKKALENIALENPKSIAVIPATTGRVARLIADTFPAASVTGYHCPGYRRYQNFAKKQQDENVKFVLGLPKKRHHNVVFSISALQWRENRLGFCKKLSQVLKPKGTLILTVLKQNREHPLLQALQKVSKQAEWGQKVGIRVHAQTEEKVRKLFHQAGLQVQECDNFELSHSLEREQLEQSIRTFIQGFLTLNSSLSESELTDFISQTVSVYVQKNPSLETEGKIILTHNHLKIRAKKRK